MLAGDAITGVKSLAARRLAAALLRKDQLAVLHREQRVAAARQALDDMQVAFVFLAEPFVGVAGDLIVNDARKAILAGDLADDILDRLLIPMAGAALLERRAYWRPCR